jgi:general secretion pathway protein A
MYNDYFGFRVAPFSATPDPDLYYTTPLHQQTFATLEYGVTAKKGFIVISGEAGTGKTTLLHKFLHSLGPTVHSVFIFNTQINFDELLRFILRELELTSQTNDRATMIEVLNDYLIKRLEEGHIVCLLIDEAQNLGGETLEGLRLLSNLETGKEKLLQIVLAGQPELEKKLERPELRQLKQRVVLRCHLAALAQSEVGSYIDVRLKAAGYQGKGLFRPDAVEQIAFYSGGIPRLINIICDNALLTAYADSQKEIAAEVIKEVAGDLRLSEWTELQPLPEPEALPRQEEFCEETAGKIVPNEVWQSRLGLNSMPAGLGDEPMGLVKKSQAGLRMATLFTFLLFGGAGAVIYSGQARTYLAHLGSNFENQVGHSSAENVASNQPENIHEDSSQAIAPSTPPALTPEQQHQLPSLPEASDPGVPRPVTNETPENNRRERADDLSGQVKKRSSLRDSNEPNIQKKKIELAISHAIQNRAISGVAVSFADGTAYLDGQVATERQKSMAERAARSVPDVKYVRNRLDVKFS